MDNKEKLIMVDDDITILSIGRNILMSQYDVFTVPSGDKLFKLLEKITPCLILLDVEMPEMNGYDVIKKLKRNARTSDIPVIFLTGKTHIDQELEGLSMGAIDYITKPFSPQLLLKRIEVHLLVEAQKNELKNYSDNLEVLVREKTKTVFELQNAVIKTVAELVECRDGVTGGHIERTTRYLKILLDAMQSDDNYREALSGWDIELLLLSAQLHDVGKIAIKDSILLKPSSLTEAEYREMKMHTVYGIEIIRKIKEKTRESAFLEYAEILAGSHHEKWDGSGYPLGLSGERIPLLGRLMAIVDVYDALTNIRPYKRAFSHKEAVEIISGNSGTHFDPSLIKIFIQYENQLEKVCLSSGIQGQLQPDSSNSGAISALQSAFSSTLAEIINYRDGADSRHIDQIQRYTKIMVNAMQHDKEFKQEVESWDIDAVIWSSPLYDVGKIAIKDDILKKPAKLTHEEFETVKTHTDFGVKVIQKIGDSTTGASFAGSVGALAGSHHEKWDGSGYPLGLSGDNIPLQGRLMAIIDVYEALVNDRPYKKALTHEQAIAVIKNECETHFDPRLVKIFIEHEKEFLETRSQ